MLTNADMQNAENDYELFDLIESALDNLGEKPEVIQYSVKARIRTFAANHNKDLPNEIKRKLKGDCHGS